MCSHHRCIEYLTGMDWLEFERGLGWWRRENNADALRPIHHVGIGDYVSLRIDDDPRSNRMLPGQNCPIGVSIFLRRAVPGNHDLDHSG